MATNTKEKELLQRINIRTMKKDLKQLRELDARKESERIVMLKTARREPAVTQQQPQDMDVAEPKLQQKSISIQEKEQLEPESIPNIPPRTFSVPSVTQKQPVAQDQHIPSHVKMYANEVEKQQIFSLESEKRNLETQLTPANKGRESSNS